MAQLALDGSREDVAVAVWDFIAAFGAETGFTPYPDDELERVLGIAEEELEVDLIAGTCRQLGLELPTQRIVDEIGELATLRHVVRLISACPQRTRTEEID